MPPLRVQVRGMGPPLLLVHGSAADAATWTIQLSSLSARFRMLAPHRRGTPGSPLEIAGALFRVEEHAAEMARVIDDHAGEPVLGCGSSFGAVVLLELARRRPDLLRGMVLCEPPLPPSDQVPAVPSGLGCALDRIIATEGGPAAGAYFLRLVLGEEAFSRMPQSWRQRACALWQQIRLDTAALAHYRVGYDSLAQLEVPALLLGGARSGPWYRPTLEALALALPHAELRMLRGASHMMHADAHRAFNDALIEFEAGLP